MKIPLSIRDFYASLSDEFVALKERIDREITGRKDRNWFYSSRVKELESFSQKLETGRVDPKSVEDLFACTLVVRNYNEIPQAIELVESICEIDSRRPKSDKITHKNPDSFPFDDLRLYVKYRDDEALPPSGLNHLKFEVQIKTFLQHAWSIATHDLVYKTDSLSWAKSRIAYQIKAMLEHAEISIDEAATLALSPQLGKSNKRTDKLTKVIEFLRKNWTTDELPIDVLRLAETIDYVIWELQISVEDLEKLIEAETAKGRGTALANLSPYAVVIQTIFDTQPALLSEALTKTESKFKMFLSTEVEVPKDLRVADFVNITQIPD